MTVFPADVLATAGLNLCHVFDVAALPDNILAPLALGPDERRLILLGHAGRRLWDCVQASGIASEHPIDDYTLATVDRVFRQHLPGIAWRAPYPGDAPIGLQALGALAGWHHESPFRVGIDPHWGSWFAYRAVLLTDGDFSPSQPVDRSHPCADCVDRPCLAACPPRALDHGFDLKACAGERLRPGAACAEGCLARQACPVGAEHRYAAEQIRHSYSRSLAMLRQYFADGTPQG